VQKRPTLEAPTEAEINTSIEFLYPTYKGLYTDEHRKNINTLARELMLARLKKERGVH